MNLKHPFPPLTNAMLDKVDGILHTRFGYRKMPADYRAFLLKHNGGFVSPGYVDDTEATEHGREIVFDTPLKWVRMDNAAVQPALVSFFGVWLEDEMDEDAVENWDLCELVLSNAYSSEDFDVLPDNIMSVAKCQHPDAADILCISLADEDYGAVYYNYGMCDHPSNFHGDYYEKRTEEVLKAYGLTPVDTGKLNEDDPAQRNIINQLKRVTFVRVADSFDAFLQGCREVDVPAD